MAHAQITPTCLSVGKITARLLLSFLFLSSGLATPEPPAFVHNVEAPILLHDNLPAPRQMMDGGSREKLMAGGGERKFVSSV
jgi:hypothetical protein